MFIFFGGEIFEKQNEKYEYIVNSAISNIVDTVIEKYPDVREEEILNILRNTKYKFLFGKNFVWYYISDGNKNKQSQNLRSTFSTN